MHLEILGAHWQSRVDPPQAKAAELGNHSLWQDDQVSVRRLLSPSLRHFRQCLCAIFGILNSQWELDEKMQGLYWHISTAPPSRHRLQKSRQSQYGRYQRFEIKNSQCLYWVAQRTKRANTYLTNPKLSQPYADWWWHWQSYSSLQRYALAKDACLPK